MSRDRTRTRDRSEVAHTDGEFDASAFDVSELEFEFDDTDADAEGTAASRSDETAERSGNGLRSRATERARRLFSPRAFVAALLVSVAGLLAAGTLVPLPGAGLLGVFVATFLFGLVLSERRYAEAALAGGITVGASTLLDFAVVAFLGGFGVPLAALGAAIGAGVGVLGNYFGRDLRAGLTRDI